MHRRNEYKHFSPQHPEARLGGKKRAIESLREPCGPQAPPRLEPQLAANFRGLNIGGKADIAWTCDHVRF